MATTSNYGWTTPDDSSLVKDGASAIRTLGSAIDTSLNTALGTKKAGMVLLNTTSFSGVASQAVTFASSTYDNYRVMFNLYSNSLTDSNMTIKMRSGATDNSSALYSYASYTKTRTGSDGQFVGNDVSTGFRIFQMDDGGGSNTTTYTASAIDLFDIFATKFTRIIYTSHFLNASTLPSLLTGSGVHAVASSFDGINFISDGATFSGQVSIYGYNK